MSLPIARIVGMAGVVADENPAAKTVGQWFEWPMLVVACVILIEWYLSFQPDYNTAASHFVDWVTWLLFLTETLLLSRLVDQPKRYLLSNWGNLVILAGGVLTLLDVPNVGVLRGLRLLVILVMLVNLSGLYRKALFNHHLGATLMVVVLLVSMAGTLMALLDPGIKTPIDGIWWAWITVTTVGYGDVVPVTLVGRIFAGFLILLGIGLVATLTASISSLMIHKDEENQNRLLRQQQEQLDRMEAQMNRLEAALVHQSLERRDETAPENSKAPD